MKEIQIYGAGGHSFAVIELIRSLNTFKPIVVLDDSPIRDNILGVPVRKFKEVDSLNTTVISVGNNIYRSKIFKKLSGDFPTFVHKSAVVYPSASLGKGCVVFPNSVIDADAHLGDFCIVNNNATISHNVVIESFVHVAIQASIAGGVHIGKGTLIGAGSVLLPEIKIGKWVTVGAGAIVTKDVPDHAIVYGNPAKKIN